jgi:GTP cyclohydrolase I
MENEEQRVMSSRLEELFRELLAELGEDPNREGLVRTPHRAAEAFRFMTQGYRQDVETLLNRAVFSEPYGDMVLVKNIEFYSLCEHHLLPFFGEAHVAYIPNGKIIGLSKIARLVNMFARRLQVQERMTQEIGRALEEAIKPRGVAVVVEAKHMCMMVRGVQKQNSLMVTSHVSGDFYDDPATRSEVLSLLGFSRNPVS